MFKNVFLKKLLIGHQWTGDGFIVFFSNKNTNQQNIEEKYSQFNFSFIKQVHGNKIIHSKGAEHLNTQADAQWTDQSHLVLCIKTADCVPIMLAHSKLICSIHAGWRGLESHIISKSIKNYNKYNVKANEVLAFIGPHIAVESFEVGPEVAARLKDSSLTLPNFTLSEDELSGVFVQCPNEKFKVDLHALTVAELLSCGIEQGNIFSLPVNTFENNDYHSFRRDGELAGRQISFIGFEKN